MLSLHVRGVKGQLESIEKLIEKGEASCTELKKCNLSDGDIKSLDVKFIFEPRTYVYNLKQGDKIKFGYDYLKNEKCFTINNQPSSEELVKEFFQDDYYDTIVSKDVTLTYFKEKVSIATKKELQRIKAKLQVLLSAMEKWEEI